MVYSVSIKKPKINNARLKEVSENTWSVLVYILNGFVFMIVGLQLPNIIKTAYLEATINTPVAILYILIISFVLLFLRFIWVLFMYSIGDKSSEGATKKKFSVALKMENVPVSTAVSANLKHTIPEASFIRPSPSIM